MLQKQSNPSTTAVRRAREGAVVGVSRHTIRRGLLPRNSRLELSAKSLWCVGVAVAAVGCASAAPAPGAANPSTAGADVSVSPGPDRSEVATPGDFTSRTPLPQCQAVTLDQGEEPPLQEIDACLKAGRTGGTGAEAVVTRPTIEGDLTTTYYRSRPGEPGLQLIVDASQDRYGGGLGWYSLDCPTATSVDDLGLCTDLPLS